MTLEKTDEITRRVFCIGMNKTGTSTMRHCFKALDLEPIASPSSIEKNYKGVIKQFYSDHNYQELIKLAKNYKSFEDRPWNMWEVYRYLDEHFPDSLFVLTVRSENSWWASVENWVTIVKPQILDRYKMHLRCNDFDKEALIDSYRRHNEDVINYFKGTDKLLVMNFEKGDGWEKLCKFLGKPIPQQAFPHANKQNYNSAEKQLVKQTRNALNKTIECQACHHITQMAKVSKPKNFKIKTKLSPLRKLKLKLQNSLKFLQKKENRFSSVYYTNQLNALQRRHRELSIDKLAIVSCFFNPSNSKQRTNNFNKFLKAVEHAGVHTLVVELAFGSRDFEIEHEHMIRLRSNSIMWHKERLLNIGIKQLLNQGYEKIAWLDGDITFLNPNWPWLISAQLEINRLCQVFNHAHIKVMDGSTIHKTSAMKRFQQSSVRLKDGKITGQTGFGWAARSEVLQQVLLYDKAIIGGGDKMIFMASVVNNTQHEYLKELTYSHTACEKCGHRNMSPPYTADYLAWAQKWGRAVDQQVGYVDMEIEDMFHGKRSDRKYMSRRNILFRHKYDPENDLSVDDDGCFKLSGNKQELSKDLHSYFLSRRENV